MKLNNLIVGGKSWPILSTAIFLAAWFLPIWNNETAAIVALHFIRHHYDTPLSEKLSMLGVAGSIFGIIAFVAGWILHFPVSIVLSQFSRAEKDSATTAPAAV